MQNFVAFEEFFEKKCWKFKEISTNFRMPIFRNLTDFPLVFYIFPTTKHK